MIDKLVSNDLMYAAVANYLIADANFIHQHIIFL